MESSKVLSALHSRRIECVGEYCYKRLMKYRKVAYARPFAAINAKTRIQYYKLAVFLLKHKLHPELYLSVMVEYQVYLYPTSLYGEKALQRYNDYIVKTKRRYKDEKSFIGLGQVGEWFSILKHDLYTVACMESTVAPSNFFKVIDGKIVGGVTLKKHLSKFKDVIDPKTYTLLEGLILAPDVLKCKSYRLIKEAIRP
jgi:hypothetical protein